MMLPMTVRMTAPVFPVVAAIPMIVGSVMVLMQIKIVQVNVLVILL